jgi:hypothetical protein
MDMVNVARIFQAFMARFASLSPPATLRFLVLVSVLSLRFVGWAGIRVVALEDMGKLSGQSLAVFQQELGNALFIFQFEV